MTRRSWPPLKQFGALLNVQLYRGVSNPQCSFILPFETFNILKRWTKGLTVLYLIIKSKILVIDKIKLLLRAKNSENKLFKYQSNLQTKYPKIHVNK